MSVYSANPQQIPLPTKYGSPVIVGGDGIEIPYNRVQIFGSVIPPGINPFWMMSFMYQYGEEANGNKLFDIGLAVATNPEGPWEKLDVSARSSIPTPAIIRDSQSFSIYYDQYVGKYRGAGYNRFGESTGVTLVNSTQFGLIEVPGCWDIKTWLSDNDTSTSLIRHDPFSQDSPFIGFVRTLSGDTVPQRRVAYVASGDWDTWTNKQPITAFDSPDGGQTQPYALSATSYGDKVIGLLWWLHLDDYPNDNSVGFLDAEFVWATFPTGTGIGMGSATWHRTYQPFISCGSSPSDFDYGMAGPASIAFNDGTAYIYYTAMKQKHGIVPAPGESTIGLATISETDIQSIIA